MMRYGKLFLPVAAILATLAAVLSPAATPPGAITVKVTPSVIPMGTFYGGVGVHVEGTAPLASEIIVALRGPDATEVFNKVGRVGPIWVNTGKVFISGIPSLLLVFSSKPLSACLSREEIDRCQLDTIAIKKGIEIKPAQKSGDPIADEFVKLKVRQGNYRMGGSGVIRTASLNERDLTYALDFTWPKSAPPGTYTVNVYASRGGEVKETLEVPLKVVEVGFPAMIASLARERPATYGIISVIVAVIAGFGIDFLATRVFKKKVSAH